MDDADAEAGRPSHVGSSPIKLHLIAAGRARPGPERTLYDHYAKRLRPPPVLTEVEARKAMADAARRAEESARMLAAAPAGAMIVALDETGRTVTSPELAELLSRWADRGVGAVAFLIGGHDGHDPATLARADYVLSLGAMTWPHMLVRGMLAEQLYRAQQINAGHPYHRE